MPSGWRKPVSVRRPVSVRPVRFEAETALHLRGAPCPLRAPLPTRLIQVVVRFRQGVIVRPLMVGCHRELERCQMNQIVWIVGLVVIVLFILGFLGLR